MSDLTTEEIFGPDPLEARYSDWNHWAGQRRCARNKRLKVTIGLEGDSEDVYLIPLELHGLAHVLCKTLYPDELKFLLWHLFERAALIASWEQEERDLQSDLQSDAYERGVADTLTNLGLDEGALSGVPAEFRRSPYVRPGDEPDDEEEETEAEQLD